MFTDKLNQFNQALNVNLTHSDSVYGGGVGSPNTGFFEPITGQIGGTGCNLLIIALFALAIGVTLFVLRHKFHKLHKASLVASLCIFAFGATALATAGSLNARAANTGRVADAANAVTMNLVTTPEGATTTASAHATLSTDFDKGYIVYAYVDQDPMLWNSDYSDAIDMTWPAASINDIAMNSYGIQNQDGSFDLPSIDAKKPTKIAETTNYGFAGSNLPINYALRADTTLAEGGYSTLTYAMHYQVVPNVYKLTYDYGDVAPVKTVKQDHDPIFTIKGRKASEDRAGYTFNGYTLNESRVEEDAHNYIQPGSQFVADYVDTTLYASWTANTYQVTFDTNGGQFPSGKTRTIKDEVFDSKYVMPKTTPTRTGYTFTGWYTDQDGGEKIDNESIVSTPSDHTIYAHWEAKQSTAYFDANGGEFAPGETVRTKVETFDSNYNLPKNAPTRIGYQFAGWFTPEGVQVTASTKVTTDTDHILYAHWAANTYKLSYDANGGENAPVAQEQSGNPTFKVTDVQPTRTGYTFKGWATTQEATTPEYTAGSNITLQEPETGNVSEQTLYAVWKIETYQVQFDANGGEFTPGETVRVKTETYGEKYIIPDKKPTRLGYQFAGWFTAQDGGTQVTTSTTVTTTTDHALYAHWVANTYKLSYDANGGTNAPAAQEQSGIPTFTVTADKPSLKGYKLKGWATTQDAAEPEYYAGGTITLAEPAAGSTTSEQTLYAVWGAREYQVTFNANGGNFAPSETTKTLSETYDQNYVFPEAEPTRTGYKFLGWFTAPEGGEQITDTTVVKITEATTLYAHWQLKTYVVTFDTAGGQFPDGSTSQEIKIRYLDNYQLPEKNPKREGYKFMGWFTEEDGGTKITSGDQMTTAKKHTLYAHWQANVYDVTYDANGGKFADGQTTDGPHSFAFDSPYVLPQQEVKRTGYTFAGWWTDPKGGTEVTTESKVTTAQDHTLYAHWTANKYTVTFDATDGAFGGGAKTEQIQETYDDYYALPTDDPTLDDYKFLGWFTETTTGNKVTKENKVHTASDRTLYAHWGKDLVFDANGGIFRDGTSEFTITETLNAHMVLPEPEKNPTHAGSKYFAGWWTKAEDGQGQQVTTDNIYKKATRLYAHWSDAPVTTVLPQQYPVASTAPVADAPHYESTTPPAVTRSRTSRVAHQ